MKTRLLAFAGALALAATLTLLTPKFVVGQTPNASAKTKVWKQSKTPDGQPDISGYWTNITVTPLERPKGLGAKEFYTDAEMSDNERRERERDQQALNGRGTEKGTDADVHYDFAQFGLDRGQATLAWSKRTSLIV